MSPSNKAFSFGFTTHCSAKAAFWEQFGLRKLSPTSENCRREIEFVLSGRDSRSHEPLSDVGRYLRHPLAAGRREVSYQEAGRSLVLRPSSSGN
jgi:hypothetical protein